MCGIAGFCGRIAGTSRAEMEELALKMAGALKHRGPDDDGAWADENVAVALGHRRLAILDLSQEGHQPMISANGRYVLSFNGEIYNFKPLQAELVKRGHIFRGHSDTETMLAAFCEWEPYQAIERFTGMFAFALWDRKTRKLHLARDRAGEKPLYYGWTEGVFVFGSELKSLRMHPSWNGNINRKALKTFVQYGYVAAPECIYEHVHKLTPGSLLTLTEFDIYARRTPAPRIYWSAAKIALAGAENPSPRADGQVIEQLHTLLQQSVGRQMLADVPLGAFLSGGIDSSLVVSLMQAKSVKPVKTFSIGFEQEKYNEAPFAKAIANHLGTEHNELYVRDKDLQTIIPRLPGIYDEPFADSSQIPTALLCQLAANHVKVSLSGDGGDELFYGYNHYQIGQRLWKHMRRLPASFRMQLARRLVSLAGAGLSQPLCRRRGNRLLNRMWNLSDILPAHGDHAFYQLLMSPNRKPDPWLIQSVELGHDDKQDDLGSELPDFSQRMMLSDFISYLPDDILVKVDRAAMAVSLETRVPLLDHHIIEFAFRLPTNKKRKNQTSKWPLRQILYRYVPATLVDRPKKGFSVPISEWLRGPMREWAENLLNPARLHAENYFRPDEIAKKWQEHLMGKRDWSAGLWHILMFQSWLDEQKVLPLRATNNLGIDALKIVEPEICQPSSPT